MDFITDLLLANRKDPIFVVVDLLTKMVHYVSCTKIVTEEKIARFLNNIYLIHGHPKDIVLDKGTQFISNF